MNGRIETYVHSDSTTKNKGACMVRVVCKSEAGSKTEEFRTFAKRAAQLCYGSQKRTWPEVIETFPDLEEMRLETEKMLKEPVIVDEFTILLLEKPKEEETE